MMNIKKAGIRCLVSIFLLLSCLLPAKPVHAAINMLYVTQGATDAEFGNSPSKCTLREAIWAVNNHRSFDGCAVDSSTQTIYLLSGEYALTRDRSGEDTASYGDLDIRTNLTITGLGTAKPRIYMDRSQSSDRVFDIIGTLDANDKPTITVTLQNVTIESGYSTEVDGGAGIRNTDANLILDGVTLRGNEATSSGIGGGVMNSANATLTIHDATFDGNKASMGGAIYNKNQVTITNSLFVGNVANSAGGALDNDPSDRSNGFMKLNNVTITRNTSYPSYGAGINSSGRLEGTHLTVVNNSGIGVLLNGTDSTYTATLSASILADHSPYADCQKQAVTTKFVTGGYNLVEDEVVPADNKHCAFSDSTDIVKEDPLLAAALSTIENSNSKAFSFILTEGTTYSASLAVDAIPVDHALCTGENALDQLFQTRPAEGNGEEGSGCDIGAYELGGAPTRITYRVFLPVLSKTK